MEILKITTDRGAYAVGSASYDSEIKQSELVDKLHIVTYTPRGYSESFLGDKAIFYPTNSFFKAFFLWDAFFISRKIIKNNKIDVISTWDPHETALVGCALKAFYRIALLIEFHNEFNRYWLFEVPFLNHLRALLSFVTVRFADRFRTETMRTAIFLKNTFSVSDDHIDIFPIPVDLEAFAHAQPRSDLLPLLRDRFVYMYSGRFVKQKNLLFLIRAFKVVLTQKPDAILLLIGSGSELRQMNALIADLHLNDSVIVLASVAVGIEEYYKLADVYVIPSGQEGYPRTVMEVNAAGCKMVMTRVGCADETFLDGIHGRVVDVDDMDALVAALLSPIPYAKMDLQSMQYGNYLQCWHKTLQSHL